MTSPAPAIRLLLIDDDTELADLMGQFFVHRGFQLRCIPTGAQGLEEALSGNHDLILLDVMLPGLDGFTLLRQLRKRGRTPVIMLTARASESDRIAGLDAGADDYLTKPFGPEELLARVRAVLRRAGWPAEAPQKLVHYGALTLTPASRRVAGASQEVSLTEMEYNILEQLVRAGGRVVSRRELMMVLHQVEAAPYDRSLDVHVSHLRKKLVPLGAGIQTIRGEGYQIALGVAARP
jgi:two-component system response regulator CpxR